MDILLKVGVIVAIALVIKWLFGRKKPDVKATAKPKRSPRRARKAKPKKAKARKARRKKKAVKPSRRLSTKHSRDN